MSTKNTPNAKGLQHNLWKAALLPYLLFILIPLFCLLLGIRPADLLHSLQEKSVWQAIRLSLTTSSLSVLVTLVIGTPVAYFLSYRQNRFFRLLDTLVDLPTVLPPAVAGVALLMAFGRRGLLGGWLNLLGISLPFTTAAVVMAQTFVAGPLYIKSAALGFSAIDCELKKAAALDGANHWQIFHCIVLPMSWASLLTGSMLTWARALGEFGATIIFAGNYPGRTQTMPSAIYIGFQMDMSVAITLAVILVVISFIALITVKWFVYRYVEPETEVTFD
ncbi:molybdate ABC transporter, permease protein [Longilinea arvoryzae]|uniref:Molybdenum transport system permease n=1 Tax=Longilinea arvoryzae TaxID=360412 RepID=A0A0S7BGW9_9CHLR|nr:ABC transporter permease [Longilinea arvoryzae]GAP14324.1 molybdate ABC transporter, permease protein [Longilinea arvoryzae]